MESQGGLPVVRVHCGSCPLLGSLESSGVHSKDVDGLPRGPCTAMAVQLGFRNAGCVPAPKCSLSGHVGGQE